MADSGAMGSQEVSDLTLDGSAKEPAAKGYGEDGAEGFLLSGNEADVHAAVLNNWKSQETGLSYQLCEVSQAEFWRSGERWVFIRPGDDDKSHDIWRPPGVDRIPPTPDKVDQLVRRLTAQLLVDEPKLDGDPATGEEQAQQAAELTTRIFEVEGGRDGWNLRLILEGAIDIATTQKSAFAHVMMDPQGGGRQSVTVMAAPHATMYDPANPEACLLEPMETPQGPQMVPTADPVTKFLNPDNTLTATQTAETVMQWVAWPEIALLGMRNVRFIPEYARGQDDADGQLVLRYVPIDKLKRWFPETVGQMDQDQLRTLRAWKPFPKYSILPDFARDPMTIGTKMPDGSVPDDAVALVLSVTIAASAAELVPARWR